MTSRSGPSICKCVAVARLFAVVLLLGSAFSATAQSSQVFSPAPAIGQTSQTSGALTLDEAVRLANTQASVYQTAILNERIAAEDVKQAQAAFKPKISAPLSYIYTSPALGLPPGEPRGPSFIANNAVSEYEAL